MIKTTHRILAAVAVLCLCITALPSAAFAAEDGFITSTVTTTETVTDDEGNTVVTVTVQKTQEGITDEGVAVSRQEAHSDITVADDDGGVVRTGSVDEGAERREWDEQLKPGEETVKVKVELKPGETATGSAEDSSYGIDGDKQQSPDDKEYDYTKTTQTTQRNVSAETSDVDVVINIDETDLESVRAEDYQGKDANVFGPDFDFVADAAENVPQPEDDGYDYQLVGYGDATNELKVLRDYITYKKVDGQPVKDENGNYIIEKIETKVDNTPMQIALRKDQNGEYEYFFGYCIDSDTETVDGAWYKVSNLEDSDYYPNADSAAKLRAIVTNGYWGKEIGMGSVAQIKALIKSACGENAEITVDADNRGGKATYKIADIIDSLTEAEALAATQAAIWCFANGDSDTRDGKDGYIAHGPVNVYKPNPDRNAYAREYLPESDARAMAVFNWLRSIEGIDDTQEDVSTVINGKNAVKNMSVTIGGKADDHARNTDTDTDNDVYDAELNFTLAFVPDKEKDDLLVYLLDEKGDPIEDKDGNPVIRRLAGKNSDNRSADTIQPDENGVYTLAGLQLGENEDFRFDLHLEGTQYLNEGVYIYTAHGGTDKSQTVVGIAEGTHTVDVSVDMTVRFDVDENKHVVTERVWRIENSDPVRPETPEEPPAKETVTEMHIAEPVKTGDISYALIAAAAVSTMGLCAVCFMGRKTKEN